MRLTFINVKTDNLKLTKYTTDVLLRKICQHL